MFFISVVSTVFSSQGLIHFGPKQNERYRNYNAYSRRVDHFNSPYERLLIGVAVENDYKNNYDTPQQNDNSHHESIYLLNSRHEAGASRIDFEKSENPYVHVKRHSQISITHTKIVKRSSVLLRIHDHIFHLELLQG